MMRAASREQVQRLRSTHGRQRGFIINPFAFGGGPPPLAATWNSADKSANVNLSVSDTVMATTSGSTGGVRSVGRHQTSGKRYAELKFLVAGAGGWPFSGVCTSAMSLGAQGGNQDNNWTLRADGVSRHNFSNTSNLTGTINVNDVIQIAVDIAAQKLWFGKNGTFAGNPGAGTGQAWSNIPTGSYVYVFTQGASNGGNHLSMLLATVSSEFAHSPPSGFSGWDD